MQLHIENISDDSKKTFFKNMFDERHIPPKWERPKNANKITIVQKTFKEQKLAIAPIKNKRKSIPKQN